LEAELAEFNGEADHVRLLVSFPPKVAVARLASSLKGVPSRRMRQEFPGTGPALLAGTTAVFRVVLRRGVPTIVLRQLIEQQRSARAGSPRSAPTTGLKVGAQADT